MADATPRVSVHSPASVGRWTSLRSVHITPPGSSPRVLLRPLRGDLDAGVTETELRRRAEATERVRDTVPRLLMEFADRLEAVFERGTVLHFDFGVGREEEQNISVEKVNTSCGPIEQDGMRKSNIDRFKGKLGR